MKASVQYNDFIGTAAADISDHTNLNEFISSKGLNIDRYEAIGASFFSAYRDFFSVSIICIDKQQSTETEKFITRIRLGNKFEKNEFFHLFERFNVVITPKHDNYGPHEINEEITFEVS